MNYGGFDTKFDGMGASQFAGGGFVPSPHAGGGDAFGDKKGGAGGKAMAQTMRNVTIRQIMKENFHEENNKVDSVELSTFFLVGRIVSRSDSATVLKLKLDDGTAIIEVVYYPEESDNELINNMSQEWTLNSNVRVCGHMRAMDGKQSMTAFRIKLIKDYNEYTYHTLQCVFQHLHLTKGGMAAPPMTAQYGSRPAPAAAPSANGDFKSKIHMDVLAIYNESLHNESGLGLEEVLAALASRGLGYSSAEVQKTVEFLANEGQLYSTIDDFHFRSTA